jgi:hypothetical protein
MRLFKKKIYKTLGINSQSFKLKIPSDRSGNIRICSGCEEIITGKIYYCPKCKKYYGFKCVTSSVGGCTCSVCEEVTYLKTVHIIGDK